MSPRKRLTHVDDRGSARMVDVTEKAVTSRRAVAEGHIVMAKETLRLIVTGKTAKGNVLQVAELAGVMGGKKTADLIPLCHALPGTTVKVSLEADEVPCPLQVSPIIPGKGSW